MGKMGSDNTFLPLSELERDALSEIANVAMGRAATSLRQLCIMK
jgi:chemotaxis protein CheY-P-specific phosphatase CheC